jgi:hypothetical protein
MTRRFTKERNWTCFLTQFIHLLHSKLVSLRSIIITIYLALSFLILQVPILQKIPPPTFCTDLCTGPTKPQNSYRYPAYITKSEIIHHLLKKLLAYKTTKQTPWPLVRKRTIPTERPPLVGEVSVNFCGYRVSPGQRNGSPRPLISVS